MSSWYSSWLPGLPSIALPSSIQRRFISFVLKKSLGHLLKPGQLDVHQIDSQIGSGYVQVKDVELDNEAINSALTGLPIKLCDGSIAAVTARIPWPNPLTSTLGFSFQSLRLTFHLAPIVSEPIVVPPANLAESVASVAETFIHDELTPQEEATLRESFHPDLAYDHSRNVPGSMDPFLHVTDDEEFHSDVDPAGISVFAILIERLLARFEFDAVDTKITIIHPEHASFTFSVTDVCYGTEDPGSKGPDGHDRGAEKIEQTSGETRKVSISGLTLTARDLRPPVLPSPTALTPSTASPVSPKVSSRLPFESQLSHRSPSASPTSSSSSLDEDTQMLMSQSLAYLPPRTSLVASSPSSSMTSSMYQSAISTVPEALHATDHSGRRRRTPSPGDHDRPADDDSSHIAPGSDDDTASDSDLEPKNEILLSFGAEPIVIRLTTPPLSPPIHDDLDEEPSLQHPSVPPAVYHRPSQGDHKSSSVQSSKLTFSAGVLACAFRAWHIRGILDTFDAWGSHQSPSVSAPPAKPAKPSPSSADAIFALGLDASMNIRGVVILLLPFEAFGKLRDRYQGTSLDSFFARPLVPPRLAHGCVRVFLDSLSASCSLSGSTTSTESAPSQAHARTAEIPVISVTNVVTIAFALNDLSAFALSRSAKSDTDLSASPILITDQNLSSQYSIAHVHPSSDAKFTDYSQLPDFAILDWTNETHWINSTKLSTWRTKVKSKASKRRDSQTRLGVVMPSSSNIASNIGPGSPQTIHGPAVTINATFSFASSEKGQAGGRRPDDHVEIGVVPLHIFLDLGLVLGSDHALTFLDHAISGRTSANDSSCDDGEESDRDEEEDGNIFPITRERNKKVWETERQRLERLVLEDLNLDLDYRDNQTTKAVGPAQSHKIRRPYKSRRSQPQQRLEIVVNLDMIRFQVRCPPPPLRAPRSGAVIIDLHGVSLSNMARSEQKPVARFANVASSPSPPASRAQDGSGYVALLTVDCRRVVFTSSLLGEEIASVMLSLGSLSSSMDETVPDSSHFGSSPLSPVIKSTALPLPLRILVSRTEPAKKPSPGHSTSNTAVVTIDVPSVYADVSKLLLDGLQLWADDVSQLVERTFGVAGDTDTEKAESRTPSLIGSRFFAKSRRYGSKSSEESSAGFSGPHADVPSQSVIKIALSEVYVRLKLPREEQPPSVRPFNIVASDVDVLIELKPEGKDETVITLGVLDLSVNDTSPAGAPIPFVSLTAHRSLSTIPKSMVKLRFTSLVVPETTAKESRVKLTLWGFTYNVYPDLKWIGDLSRFVKTPPGAFESVIPSERTRATVKIIDGSIRGFAPTHPGAVILYIGELDFTTDIVGDSPVFSFHFPYNGAGAKPAQVSSASEGTPHWKRLGHVLLAETVDLDLKFQSSNVTDPPDTRAAINRVGLRIHLCADTLHALTSFISDVTIAFKPPPDISVPTSDKRPTTISEQKTAKRNIMSSVDEHAFRRVPDVGSAPDMINDDLPSNLDYLDASFGTAAGLRELRDEDLDDFDPEDSETGRVTPTQGSQQVGVISNVGGETVKMLRPLNIVEHHFDTLPPDSAGGNSELGETTLRIRVHDCDVAIFLYDGYDWVRTRKTIEEEVKEMRRRLTKIRQLVANGHTQDPSVEETSTLLFNSVYIGLEQDVSELEPGALIAAIDEELNDDVENESQSSWQSLRPPSTGKPPVRSTRVHGKRLTRSSGSSIEFRLTGLDAEVDQYRPGESFVSRTFATVRDLEILDHIKTSTWQKFLTELRSDSRGNIRETDSNMARVELLTVHPVPNHPSEEARLRAKILPLRLYVDQDALDFMKKFFSFEDPDSTATGPESSGGEIYFQHAEVFPVDIKMDYKPRRVDYRALREGRTIELMNFFHFDGSEMTLRHITLSGITGWPRFFDMLNDLWTPDVKATQLVDVITGVSPIRSVVNVGSGVADLVLLPIAQYKKDGRIVRGVQKGTTAFVKSTAMEAIKLSARLATGTQVILEQAEHVLGGQFKDSITAEALQVSDDSMGRELGSDEEDAVDLISKYAEQPMDVKEGVQSAYKSLQRNLNSAAQTILAVPMEVYERSGNEGPIRAVIRAVPIAVLKPMIGASEAVSKTLMGLQNTMDPNIRHENEDKYKHR